ncbi:MAG: hypothetical protein VW268_01370 [Rhodospirillaceae bacterium]
MREIKASSDRSVSEIQKLADGAALGGGAGSSQAVTQMTAQLNQLKADIQVVRTEQKKLMVELSHGNTGNGPVEPRVITKIAKPFTKIIYFPLNKVMDPNVDIQIGEVADALKKEAASRACDYAVNGCLNTLGGDKSNLALSQKRADYVAGKLRFQDLNVTDAKAWGERRLDAVTLDGVDQVRNRRVEVEITFDEKPAEMKTPLP